MSKSWTGSTRQWRVIRLAVLVRDRYRCQIRGPRCTGKATTADHITPKSEGGTDDPSNLRAACVLCNSGRGAAPLDPAPSARW